MVRQHADTEPGNNDVHAIVMLNTDFYNYIMFSLVFNLSKKKKICLGRRGKCRILYVGSTHVLLPSTTPGGGHYLQVQDAHLSHT